MTFSTSPENSLAPIGGEGQGEGASATAVAGVPPEKFWILTSVFCPLRFCIVAVRKERS
jgi:hypothetical protein